MHITKKKKVKIQKEESLKYELKPVNSTVKH